MWDCSMPVAMDLSCSDAVVAALIRLISKIALSSVSSGSRRRRCLRPVSLISQNFAISNQTIFKLTQFADFSQCLEWCYEGINCFSFTLNCTVKHVSFVCGLFLPLAKGDELFDDLVTILGIAVVCQQDDECAGWPITDRKVATQSAG